MVGSINLVWFLIAIVALLVWRARWPRLRQRGVGVCPALILCALWALSGPCLASEGAIPSAPELSAGGLPDLGIVVGDLDGDGRPEIAIVRPEGLGPKGVQYRIDLNLTTHILPNLSFTVSSERAGLRIVPRDVDGDGDMDLVITNATSLAPVSLWINDGHGGGAEGDPAAYPSSIWTERPKVWVRSNTSRETVPAILLRSPGNWLDFPLSSYFREDLVFDDVPLLPASDGPQEPAVTGPSNRGPPHSSRTWPYFSLSPYNPTEFILGHIPILRATGSPQGPSVIGPSNRSPPPSLPSQSS